MKTTVIATFRVIGFHSWPDATTPRQAYLKDPHRHEFHFRVEAKVDHGNREVEFHELQHFARLVLLELYEPCDGGRNFKHDSCEHISAKLLTECARRGWPVTAVEVWEDGENGSRVEP